MSTQKNESQAAAQAPLALRGMGTIAKDHGIKFDVGQTIVAGRSRACDWSLRRAPTYLNCTGEQRARFNQDLAFSSVSRKHVQIAYVAPDLVEVSNLSGNGTVVDGRPIDKIVLTDCGSRPHRIQLGPKGAVLHLQSAGG